MEKITALLLPLCLTLALACSDGDLTPADAGTKIFDLAATDTATPDGKTAATDLSPDAGALCSPPAAKGSFASLSAMSGGTSRSMCHYRGKVLLVANIAAKCGFTPQLADLATVQQAYGSQGFTVLGFYCNQFLNQGGTQKEQDACETQYGVNFPTFDTLKVNAPGEHPIFTWLKAQPGGSGAVKWNFEKWLIGKDGKLIKRWATAIEPDSAEIQTAIKAALAK